MPLTFCSRALALACLMLPGIGAHATIIAVSDPAAVDWQLSPPASVRRGAYESDTRYLAFTEKDDYVLPFDIPLEARASDGAPGLLLEGQTVDSHLLHVDPVGSREDNAIALPEITITFDGPVIGYYFGEDAAWLGLGDPFFGAPGTLYEPLPGLGGTPFRGAQSLGTSDFLSIAANTMTLQLSVGDGRFMDEVRIITSSAPQPRSVPEPVTLWLLGSACLAVAGVRMRRARASG